MLEPYKCISSQALKSTRVSNRSMDHWRLIYELLMCLDT